MGRGVINIFIRNKAPKGNFDSTQSIKHMKRLTINGNKDIKVDIKA